MFVTTLLKKIIFHSDEGTINVLSLHSFKFSLYTYLFVYYVTFTEKSVAHFEIFSSLLFSIKPALPIFFFSEGGNSATDKQTDDTMAAVRGIGARTSIMQALLRHTKPQITVR